MTTITVPASLNDVTIRVRFGAGRLARIKVASWMLYVVAWIAGCNVDVSMGEDDVGLTTDGLPRALSTCPRFKGYREDAWRDGMGLTIRLDGVEQRDVVSYDIDADRVSSYVRNDEDLLRLARLGGEDVEGVMIYHQRGIVTVERKPPLTDYSREDPVA